MTITELTWDDLTWGETTYFIRYIAWKLRQAE